jgi:hypothetical protein
MLFIEIKANQMNICTLNNTQTSTIYNTYIIITNFERLNMLNFKSCSLYTFNVDVFALKPSQMLILNNSLDLTGLKIQSSKIITLTLQNYKGFALKSNPFKHVQFINSNTLKIWSIQYSTFDFYDENNKLVDNKCSNLLLNNSFDNQFNGYMLILYETKFSTNMCPFIFWNIKLLILNLYRISSSFVEKNQLEFLQINETLNLNSGIQHLQVFIYHSELNAKFLNKQVFKQIKVIDLNGQITKIEQDLFKPFNKLNFVRLRTQYIQNILVHNNKWIY